MATERSGQRVLRHDPIRVQVADILRAAIVNLEFLPGEVLVERELCALTSASRPSVREALRQLESEGLIESHNGRGTVVVALSRVEAEQLYEFRAELEGYVAELFTRRATVAQREALRAAYAQIAAAAEQDVTEMRRARDAFYSVMMQGAGNSYLHDTVRGLQRRVSHFRAITLGAPGRPARSVDEIGAIMAAVESGDPAAARRAASLHVRIAAEVVFTLAVWPADTSRAGQSAGSTGG